MRKVSKNLEHLLFVCFDSLHPSQQIFSHAGTGLLELNQYLAEDNVSCPKTQPSASGEA